MPYNALAAIYDRLMSHVEYEEWIDLIRRVIARHSRVKNPEILEIGAGTGVLGESLVKMGYSYSGSDLSFSMCREARLRRFLPVCCADARALPVKKKFDLALFLYDGINYLHTEDDYCRVFQSVADALSPGGLFLFDITTEANSMTHFIDYFDYEDYGDYSFVRHSYYDPAISIQHNDFTIYKQSEQNSSLYEKITEKHQQKVLPVYTIEQRIPRSLFSVVGIWDGYTFRRYSAVSERIHFLLKKNGTA